MGSTKDFAAVIRKKLAADLDLADAVRRESFNANVALQIYQARTASGLTQQQLADRVNTRQPVIARLEDADYDGHSLSLLKRIGDALGLELRIEFCQPIEQSQEVLAWSFDMEWSAFEAQWNDFLLRTKITEDANELASAD